MDTRRVTADAGPLTVTVSEVPAAITYPLRGAVLRPGRPVEIPGDYAVLIDRSLAAHQQEHQQQQARDGDLVHQQQQQ